MQKDYELDFSEITITIDGPVPQKIRQNVEPSHSRLILTKEGAAPVFFRHLNFLDGAIQGRNTQSKQQADPE